MENLNELIRKIRIEHRYSQKEIASKLNLSQTAYAKIENGGTELTIKRLIEISSIYKIDFRKLLGVPEEKQTGKDDELEKEAEELRKRIKSQEKIINQYQEILEERKLLIGFYIRQILQGTNEIMHAENDFGLIKFILESLDSSTLEKINSKIKEGLDKQSLLFENPEKFKIRNSNKYEETDLKEFIESKIKNMQKIYKNLNLAIASNFDNEKNQEVIQSERKKKK